MPPLSEEEVRKVAIRADPLSVVSCRFTVDRPVLPGGSAHFARREQASGSPLASRLFEIHGVGSVLISHDQVTISKSEPLEWQVLGKAVGAALRDFLKTGEPAVSDGWRANLPVPEEIRARVERVLEEEINPSVAGHGGVIRLIDVKDNVVYLQLGGGCQGCGMADVTLKQGIETAIRAAVPGVGDILDVTDHASGRNPYYRPSKK
ncbi:MAG TPA: NifU family protein [Planctomycetota bacterium]|nr:NifU family protein [Planctomycetota bacterium]